MIIWNNRVGDPVFWLNMWLMVEPEDIITAIYKTFCEEGNNHNEI